MAVVLLQMGGPSNSNEIEPFLFELFSDPDMIRIPSPWNRFQERWARWVAQRRAPKVRPKYDILGGASPILHLTLAQAEGLQRELEGRGKGEIVRVAMRYTPPRSIDLLGELEKGGSPDLILLPLYPHFSPTTSGSSLQEFLRSARRVGYRGRITYIRSWGTHPSYIGLLSRWISREREVLLHRGVDDPFVLFSTHGIPKAYVRSGDPYPQEVEESVTLVAESLKLSPDRFALSYQSAFGPVRWTGPSTPRMIRTLSRGGEKGVLVVPFGFVSDHLETLYDIDTLFRSLAEERGMVFHRVPSFNDSPEFSKVLADVLGDAPRQEVSL